MRPGSSPPVPEFGEMISQVAARSVSTSAAPPTRCATSWSSTHSSPPRITSSRWTQVCALAMLGEPPKRWFVAAPRSSTPRCAPDSTSWSPERRKPTSPTCSTACPLPPWAADGQRRGRRNCVSRTRPDKGPYQPPSGPGWGGRAWRSTWVTRATIGLVRMHPSSELPYDAR
jgi:hypothetical protein